MQSCDICRKRKVKCDRHTPCVRCTRLHQPCTYTDILRKKGPKFVHSYPSIYKSTPTSASTGTLASGSVSDETLPQIPTPLGLGVAMEDTLVQNGEISQYESGSGLGSGVASELEDEFVDFDDLHAAQQLRRILGMGMGMGSKPTSDSESYIGMTMESTLAVYVEILYPLCPIVDIQEIRHASPSRYGYGPTRYAMLCSICAAVHGRFASRSSNTESGHGPGHGHEYYRTCERYIQNCLQSRRHDDSHQTYKRQNQQSKGNTDGILCSYFLFMTYWSLRREKHAWWYLRECIALLFSSRLHREDEYRTLQAREAEARRLVFWGVFVAERTFCLLRDKPITLRPWINLPQLPSLLEEETIPGFIRLVTLYRNVDVDMSGCWTAAGFVTPVTFSLAVSEAHATADDHAIDLNTEIPLAIQQLDLAVTREWLRAKAWKLGTPGSQRPISGEFVASDHNPHWRLEQPLFIGRAILGILQGFSALLLLKGCWSVMLDQKLCDICECLCDVLPVMQMRRYGEVDVDQILRGMLGVLDALEGRSAYLVATSLGEALKRYE